MKPRLVGPQNEFELGPDGTTIGRDKSNAIRLDDPLVSSFHCRIEVVGEQFVLVDTNSTNGTLVNGKLAERVPIVDGDWIRIGRTELRFVIHSDQSVFLPPPPISLEDDDDSLQETVRLDPSKSSLLKSATSASVGQFDRLAQGMSVLLKVSAEINEAANSQTLQELLLDRIFELIPADNGAIVLASAKNELVPRSAVLRRRTNSTENLSVSRTITETVMTTGQAILRNHLLDDHSVTDSLKQARVCSLLCIPLTVMGTRIGVLYLNTTVSREQFNEWHLELATAIGGIAAVALEHLRYVEWLEAENEQLKHEVAIRHDMIGKSPKMMKLFEDIAAVASGNARVLILGESGTGKELAARAIHNNSSRRTKPFVPVNCAQIAEPLFASELFGHVKERLPALTGTGKDLSKKLTRARSSWMKSAIYRSIYRLLCCVLLKKEW